MLCHALVFSGTIHVADAPDKFCHEATVMLKTSKLLANGILLTGSLTLSVVCCELGYRLLLFGWDGLSIVKINSVRDIGVSGVLQAAEYPEIVYELKPNLKTWFKLVPLETNSRGLRDKEYELVKGADVYRVAVIGDSFTMPSGVRIEEAYHTLLENKLSAMQGKRIYEFINFAVGGYTLRQYAAVLSYKALKYHPDLALIAFCPRNDHLVPPERIFDQHFEPKEPVSPVFHSFIVDGLKHISAARERVNTREFAQCRFSEAETTYVSEIFSRVGEFSRKHSIPIVVAYIDIRPSRCPTLENILSGEGIDFVNLTDAFVGRTLSRYVIYALDSHPNREANQIFAERLYEYFSKRKIS